MSEDGDGEGTRWYASFRTSIAIAIFGILIGLVATAVAFFAARKDIAPVYAVTDPQLLAEVTEDAPRLQLLWDGEVVPNVYLVKVAFRNDGRQFLGKELLSKTDPLRLEYPDDVSILSHVLTSTSRGNLVFHSEPGSEEWPNSILLAIVDDEVLERGDGGVLTVLYSGGTRGKFRIAGRIKGHLKGFEALDWPRAHRNISVGLPMGIGIGVIALSLIITYSVSVKYLLIVRISLNPQKSQKRRFFEWTFLSFQAAILTFMTLLYLYLIWKYIGSLLGPDWIM